MAIAAVSTAGDFIWAMWIPQHRPVYGLIHGMALFLAIGLVLGIHADRMGIGAAGGALTGLLAAASFYVLAPIAGFSVMFAVWFGVWIALGVLNNRLGGTRIGAGYRIAIARGVIAALTSGVAFYLIRGIWLPFNPSGLDYVVHFGAWTLAYLPGFAALLISRKPAPEVS